MGLGPYMFLNLSNQRHQDQNWQERCMDMVSIPCVVMQNTCSDGGGGGGGDGVVTFWFGHRG